MSIVLVGLNHKSAPVEIRERLSFSDEACRESLRLLVDGTVIQEGLIVSTCNRVEILTAASSNQGKECQRRIDSFLTEIRSLPSDLFRSHLYTHSDEAAVRHLFRVASSLDSMVVGEPQVLGQVRRAYSHAVSAGTAGRVLHRLVHHAFRVAKRVRNETGIASSAVSISYTAVELGRKIFGSLAECTVLLVGAGEMAELAAKHLVNAGASKLLITNRTEDAAAEMANRFGAITVPFATLGENLSQADIVICSTSSDSYVIDRQMAQSALTERRNKPLFLIDISVPRNVDPSIGEIENLFVFDIDDLASVVESNLRERQREAQLAEEIIEHEVLQFEQSLRGMDVGPLIGALQQKLQVIAQSELKKYRNRFGQLTPEQERAIEQMLYSTLNKLSHPIITRMRRSADSGDTQDIELLRETFGLEEKE
jgi:glutamyl-tRNA reductase